MSQTHEHDEPPSKQPGTSANSRSWSWRSANWSSRRGCSATRTTAVSRRFTNMHLSDVTQNDLRAPSMTDVS
jgi:hypothetical protein